MIEKYLFSIDVAPYHPNRQLSIINSNGGEARCHFSTEGNKGLLVTMFGFEDVDEQQNRCDWIEEVHRGLLCCPQRI